MSEPDGFERLVERLRSRAFVRKQQVIREEERARAVNAELKDAPEAQREAPAGAFLLVCECGHDDCRRAITVSAAQYDEVRSNPARFLVTPGHEIREYERVVDQADGVAVIEKLEYPVR